MPQCSPSARPRNKAQWLHCQQAFSCTFIGLPDTRPLPFFNNQHNNLFRGRSNGLLLDRRAERDHSALNGRWTRSFLSFFWFFSFQSYDWHAMREWEIITMLLLARPWGIFLFLMACGQSYWKLKNRRGWKHCCAFNTTKCRVQQFLDKWMEHISIQEKKEKWKKVWNEWFTTVMPMNDSLTRQEWILKIQTGRILQETTSILKNTIQGLCQWSPSSKRSQPRHETGDGLSFMKHVGFPRQRTAILAAAISQLERLKSNSSVVTALV